MKHQEKVRYSRHLILDEIGEHGQEALLKSSALVIGAGGLGSPALLYLAASGVGRVGIIDYDKVELSNLQRQIIFEYTDIGRQKAESAKDAIKDLNPDINIETYNDKIDKSNIENIISDYDIILDGSDNINTRFLVNDYCLKLKKPLVSAAILKFEGQVSLFLNNSKNEGPCYRCLYSKEPPEDSIPSCAENGVFASTAGITGTIQAAEAVKYLSGLSIENSLNGFLLTIETKKMDFKRIKLHKNKNCICSGN